MHTPPPTIDPQQYLFAASLFLLSTDSNTRQKDRKWLQKFRSLVIRDEPLWTDFAPIFGPYPLQRIQELEGDIANGRDETHASGQFRLQLADFLYFPATASTTPLS